MHIALSTKRAKSQARHLQAQMKAEGCPLAYGRCLEIVAGLHGYNSYNALEAVLPTDPPAAPETLADAGVDALESELARRGRLVLVARDADMLADDHDVPVEAVLANAERLKNAVAHSSIPDALHEVGFAVLGDFAADEPEDADPDDDIGHVQDHAQDHAQDRGQGGGTPATAVPDAIVEIDGGHAQNVQAAAHGALYKLGDFAFGRPGRYGISLAIHGRPAVWARGYVMRNIDGDPACVVAVPDLSTDTFVVVGAVSFEMQGLTTEGGAFAWERLETYLLSRAKLVGLTLTPA